MTSKLPINNVKKIREMSDAPLIMAGNISMQMRSDMTFPFAQEPNFLYVTGVNEPGWRLVYLDRRSYLIAPEISDIQVLFGGDIDFDSVYEQSGVDKILSKKDGDSLIESVIAQHDTVYSLGPDPHQKYYDFSMNPAPIELWGFLTKKFKHVLDARPLFARVRAIKQDYEIEQIQRAVDLTIEAFDAVRSRLNEYRTEYEIEADFTHFFRRNNSPGHAYEPIVASGVNACILHYDKNNCPLPENGLVLLDIGAKVGDYNADITRTYGLGVVPDEARLLHEQLQSAHEEIISLIKPGLSLKEYQIKSDEIISKIAKLPHAIGHGLGIDVHESLGGFDSFQSGMVLTVEPGVYLREKGIGIRIEDDILITVDGARNMSDKLSRTL